MLNMVDVHEEIYLFLLEKRERDSKLRFTFRKSNHSNRLEEGYWFYGNENYLAISFWSGMDWKNRTPNISFIINNLGECSLEINVSDSEIKREFVERNFQERTIALEKKGRRYVCSYSAVELINSQPIANSKSNYLSILENFLESDKANIDDIINSQNYSFNYSESKANTISFINPDEFNKWHNKIRKYRKLKKDLEKEDDFAIKEDKPGKLNSITIRGYGIIDEVRLEIISRKNQWVFLTGENGSGKTNLLRAIATILGNRLLSKNEIIENPNFDTEAVFIFKNETKQYKREINGDVKGKRRPYVQGLAMYGPYRLDIAVSRITKSNFKKELYKEQSFKSLFKNSTPLLSIDKQFVFWRNGTKREKELFEKREYFIKSVLVDIVDNLIDIRFGEENNKKITKYFFLNNTNNQEYSLTWEELSTGTKSTIAMLGDILIRLYDQQRDIYDPAELRGIVIIDEIDLHLHPKAQKDLVINLSKTFPNIQFIVSTHSPIPLLGAPLESQIYVVARHPDSGVNVTRVDDKLLFNDMLPNSILSSPIFGFKDLFPISHNEKNKIRTENTFEEIKKNNELKSYLKSIAKNLREEK